MNILLTLLIIVVSVLLLTSAAAYICYRMAFYNPKPKFVDPEKIDIQEGEIY